MKVRGEEYWAERTQPSGSALPVEVAPKPIAPALPAINWDKWLNMPVMALWEAIALSCNIEPNQITATGQAFNDRMHIAISHLANGLLLHIEANVPRRVAFAPVSLGDIAHVAKSCRWSLPAEFPEAIAPPAIQAAPVQDVPLILAPAKPAPDWRQLAVKKAVQIIERQRSKDLYPSQIAIADEIAREFRAGGTVGKDGKPLTGAYIKRHALKGISSDQGKHLSIVPCWSK